MTTACPRFQWWPWLVPDQHLSLLIPGLTLSNSWLWFISADILIWCWLASWSQPYLLSFSLATGHCLSRSHFQSAVCSTIPTCFLPVYVFLGTFLSICMSATQPSPHPEGSFRGLDSMPICALLHPVLHCRDAWAKGDGEALSSSRFSARYVIKFQLFPTLYKANKKFGW